MYKPIFKTKKNIAIYTFFRKRDAWYAIIVRKGKTDPFDILHIELYSMILHVVLALPDKLGGSKFWVIGSMDDNNEDIMYLLYYVVGLQKTHLLEEK